jgi:hypothetical protein
MEEMAALIKSPPSCYMRKQGEQSCHESLVGKQIVYF